MAALLNIGDLDRRIAIQRPVGEHELDGAGSGGWETVVTVWAQVQDMLPSRGERMAEGLNVTTRPARVRIRFRTDVTAAMRFVLGARIMQIGRYIFANPTGMAGPVLWGKPVVESLARAINQFLCGAFAMAAQIFDREDVTVQLSTEDRDNFVKNMVTILAEERLALAVYRPAALIKGNFTGAN